LGFITVASLTAVLIIASAFGGKGGKGKKGIMPSGWHGDYDEARAVAKQTGKPLFVVFR
jgi:hypothetical protein